MYKRGYRYIARDQDGTLYMYVEKPEKGIVSWGRSYNWENICMFNKLFTNVTWDDKKPYKIPKHGNKVKLVDNEVN